MLGVFSSRIQKFGILPGMQIENKQKRTYELRYQRHPKRRTPGAFRFW